MAHAIIRLRGKHNINPQTRDTLRYLRLTRVNHCVVLPDDETTRGMLGRAKDYVTWGPVDAGTLAKMIRSRGRIVGDVPLTDGYVKEHTSFASVDELAGAVADDKLRYRDVPEVKPIFRLHPAHGGLEGIKRTHKVGGALGDRGAAINDLILRMGVE